MLKKYAVWFAFTVPLAWGASYMFMQFGLAGVPPLTVVALRCGLAFLLTAGIFYQHIIRMTKQAVVYSAIAGAILCLVFLGLLYGVLGTSVATAGFLTTITVVIVPALQGIIYRRWPSTKVMLGVALVTWGLYLLNGGGLADLNTGALKCLGAAFLYAIHIIVSKKFVSEVDPIALGVSQLGFAAVFAVIFAFLLETPTLPQTPLEWVGILGLAFICSAYGFVMQALTQKYVTPECTGFMFSLEPVFSAILAFVFLQERLSALGYLGAALIFCGVLVANTHREFSFTHTIKSKILYHEA